MFHKIKSMLRFIKDRSCVFMPNLNRFVGFTSDKLISLKNASSVSIILINSIMNNESFGEKVKKFWQCTMCYRDKHVYVGRVEKDTPFIPVYR